MWADLTASMALVNADYRTYREQCHTFSPPRISCKLLDFDGLTNENSIVRLGEIIDEICCKCKDSDFCENWYNSLLQIETSVLGPINFENKEESSYTLGTNPFNPAHLQSSPFSIPNFESSDPIFETSPAKTPYNIISDPCASISCPEGRICKTNEGSYSCVCPEFYQSQEDSCVPKCQAQDFSCPEHQICENTPSGAQCVCPKGQEKDKYGFCVEKCDENQCSGNPCPGNSKCTNLCKEYKCECYSGYYWFNGQCVPECDGNQCEDGDICGETGKCYDKCKGYVCKCPKGYLLHQNKCISECDLMNDPCKMSTSICGQNGICEKTCSGFKCSCKEGYRKNYLEQCVPICNAKCEAKSCPENSTCIKDCTKVTCACNEGFEMTNGECVEICTAECTDNSCPAYATCTEDCNDIKCTCDEGYEMKNGKCDKICTATCDANSCPANSTCSENCNVIQCTCNQGYEMKNGECVQICTASCDAYSCPSNSQCTENCTDVSCSCKDGYVEDPLTKECILECDEKQCEANPCKGGQICVEYCVGYECSCPKDATCKVVGENFSCACKKGFFGNGISCEEEIDECKTGSHRCHENATCKDRRGGYDCSCKSGFFGNGYHCVAPVNECVLGTHECDSNAQCIDLMNGYKCECKTSDGFHGNGRICKKSINECAQGLHTCAENAQCIDLADGFDCSCLNDFYGDGFSCRKRRTCTLGNDEDICSIDSFKLCNLPAMTNLIPNLCSPDDAREHLQILASELELLSDLSTERSWVTCSPGAAEIQCELLNVFKKKDLTSEDLFSHVTKLTREVFGSCDMINECESGEHKCVDNSNCVDLKYGYDCECIPGFTGNGHIQCNQVDSCATVECPAFSDCITGNQNRAKCVCREGFQDDHNLVGKLKRCMPIDPCSVDNGGCSLNAKCSSSIFGHDVNYSCSCNPGFFGDGFSCEILDPCKNHNCDKEAKCIPKHTILAQDDYECICNDGFVGNGFICQKPRSLDPCSGLVCANNAHTTISSMRECTCECNQDYFGDGFTICLKNEPCARHNCSTNAQCKISLGGDPLCECVDGFHGDGYHCVNNCEDIDECALGLDNCCENARCLNTPGSFNCICEPGFYGDGVSCHPNGNIGARSFQPSFSEIGLCSFTTWNLSILTDISKKFKFPKYSLKIQSYFDSLFEEMEKIKDLTVPHWNCHQAKIDAIPCQILHFPEDEPQCQKIQRIERIFDHLKKHCDADWNQEFFNLMNFIMQNNRNFGRGACKKINAV
ncbi:unnamed protein product [Oikopleura dioica]|uniref:EGF-like domain-containing protein n=1 Tax=Oikopleura dioica TaxID=34765 RepID=E4XAC7_OIKDI|nr:unnamed protein product [Oikopleura dioica]